MTDPKRILLLRADAIGDHVLASSLLPLLKAKWPRAHLTVLCPALVADLFQACPFVDQIIPFQPGTIRNHWNRMRLRWRLRRPYDLAVNTVFSRDTLVDFLARRVRAKRFLAFNGDSANQSRERLTRNNPTYTELVEAPAIATHVLDRLGQMARTLGLEGELKPQAWFSDADKAWADRLLKEHGIQPGQALAFFPGSGTPQRRYPGYAQALRAFLHERPTPILALGSPADASLAVDCTRELKAQVLNLCGKTTLPQAAAILARCRLAVGAESGLAHLAWAVGTPHAVVLGGGHFGRFMPRAPLTTSACLPMDCFGCNWDCRWDRPHCIQDLPPDTLTAAMTAAWEGSETALKIYIPEPSPAPEGHAAPVPPLPNARAALVIPVPNRTDRGTGA